LLICVTMRGGRASARRSVVWLMNFRSAMAASTAFARFSAAAKFRDGASLDGDFTTPASIAASARVMVRADLPK
jgi:hypothetical protein